MPPPDAELPVLPDPQPTYDLPMFLRIRMAFCVVPAMIVFIAMLVYAWRLAVWVVGCLGTAGPLAVGLLAVYLIAAFYVAQEPYFSQNGLCAPPGTDSEIAESSAAANGVFATEKNKDK